MLEIARHDGVQEFALKTTLVYISGSLEKSGQGSHGASTLRRGHCHDPQHSGACRTYFPWPRTRRVDPGSILAEQCTMPDEATKVGMRNTDTHICVPSLLVHNVYIYIQPVLGISPVWKLTKMSHKPSVRFCPHSEPSVLDALYLSISDLSSVSCPIPLTEQDPYWSSLECDAGLDTNQLPVMHQNSLPVQSIQSFCNVSHRLCGSMSSITLF